MSAFADFRFRVVVVVVVVVVGVVVVLLQISEFADFRCHMVVQISYCLDLMCCLDLGLQADGTLGAGPHSAIQMLSF